MDNIRFLPKAAYNELFNCLHPDERWVRPISIDGSETIEALVFCDAVTKKLIFFASQMKS